MRHARVASVIIIFFNILLWRFAMPFDDPRMLLIIIGYGYAEELNTVLPLISKVEELVDLLFRLTWQRSEPDARCRFGMAREDIVFSGGGGVFDGFLLPRFPKKERPELFLFTVEGIED